MNNKKTILIFALPVGGGHISVCKTLKDILSDKYNVEVISHLGDKFLFDNLERIYSFSVSYLNIWQIIFNVTFNDRHEYLSKIYNIYLKHILIKKIKEYSPDLIISLNSILNLYIHSCSVELNIPDITYISDPFTIHSSWFNSHLKYIFVPFEETKEYVIKRNSISDTSVLTFPINPKYTDDVSISRDEFFDLYGLDKEKKIIVISSGGFGNINVKDINLFISSLIDKYNLIVICAKNEKLYKYLTQRYNNNSLKILGFVDNMDEILSFSYIHFLKSGPSMLFETIEKGVIPFIFASYGAQEKGNIEFILNKKLGYYGNMKQLLSKLPLNNSEFEIMINNIHSFVSESNLKNEREIILNKIDEIAQ